MMTRISSYCSVNMNIRIDFAMKILPMAVLLLLVGFSDMLASDQVPAAMQKRPIALVGATIHTVSGDIITNGSILFIDGKITAIGNSLELPANTETIDVSGKHVYPAMIDANTALGLVEISAVRATRDYAEAGGITPEVRAMIAFNPDSELLPVTRANGVAIALSVPRGGLVSGTSSLMMLDGWTPEQMAIAAEAGIHIRWPNMRPSSAAQSSKSKEEQHKKIAEQLQKLDVLLSDARAYHKAANTAGSPHTSNIRLASLEKVITGELPFFVHADHLRQIQAALQWTEDHKVRMVLVGGYDAWRVADELKKRQIPVILEGIHNLPDRRWESYDEPFTVAKKLADAGVRFCVAGGAGSPFGAAHVRNLPYHAATAVAYGLSKEDGLKSVTLYPAQILGVADRLGSLESGKDATLMVTDGDPLEITTRVEHLFLQGRKVDISSRHTQLYEKYRAKYRQLDLIEKGGE